MQIDLMNLLLSFIEGLALIVSPCILPVLPVILSTSLTGGKRRPLGIILGFTIFFAIFTFYSRQLVQISGVNLNLIRYLSFGILIILGCIMLSTYLTEKFSQITQRLGTIGSRWNNPQGGFFYGLFFGALIGLIWTPCAGPILAAVIVQIIVQKTNINSFLTILSFSIGVAIPMLVIVLFGQKIIAKMTFLKRNSIIIRKILGGIIILSVFYMIVINEKGISLKNFPSSDAVNSASLIDKLPKSYPAPPIINISAWINSEPLTLDRLKGQVVLIDFWAYSCINCIRTIPALKYWYQKYHDQGLVIIGIHSPEFDFESKLENVKKAVKNYDIKYPVALDNQFSTWQNYNNQYWPADYLINKDGNIVYQHFGEGNEDVIENNIRVLLGLNQISSKPIDNTGPAEMQTPETYLGYDRLDKFQSPGSVYKDQEENYIYPRQLSPNGWALNGKWSIQNQKIIAMEKNAAIKLKFTAKKVFAVMGNQSNQSITITVKFNNQVMKSLQVKNHDLYILLELNKLDMGIVELITSAPGLEIYTFTFG